MAKALRLEEIKRKKEAMKKNPFDPKGYRDIIIRREEGKFLRQKFLGKQ